MREDALFFPGKGVVKVVSGAQRRVQAFLIQRRLGKAGCDVKRFVSAERGADALVSVFVIEDGKDDATHRGSVREDAHWLGAPSDIDGIGRAEGFALGQRFGALAGQQFVEISRKHATARG